VINHNPTRTRLFRKLQRLRLSRALVLHTNIRQLSEISRALAVLVSHVANEHAEAGLEGSHFAGLGRVEEGICHVVYHHAAVCLFDALLRALGNALVGSVAGFEVDYCGPVITYTHTLIFLLSSSQTTHLLKSSAISHVVHVDSLARSWPFWGSMVTLKEFCFLLDRATFWGFSWSLTYASNDLVNMRRRICAGVDQWIQALDSELRASKA
jgi:hypothetical protein